MAPLCLVLLAGLAAAEGLDGPQLPPLVVRAPRDARDCEVRVASRPSPEAEREAKRYAAETPGTSEAAALNEVVRQYCAVDDALRSMETDVRRLPEERLEQIKSFGPRFERLRADYPYGWAMLRRDGLPEGEAPEPIKRIIAAALVDQARLEGQLLHSKYAEAQAKTAVASVRMSDASDWSFDKSAGRGSLSLADFRPGGRLDLHTVAPLPQAGFKPKDVPLESFEALTDGVDFDGPERVPVLFGLAWKGNPAKAAFDRALRCLVDIPTGRETLNDVQKMREHYGAQFEARARELSQKPAEQLSADDKAFLAAVEKDPKPHVLVRIADAGPLAGGFARSRIELSKDGRFTTEIVLSNDLMKDENPGRAVDKVLVHELRHMADKPLIDAEPRGLGFQLIEDRAYLTDARAVSEQLPRMRKEPKSGTVEWMRRADVAAAKQPTSFRARYLRSPLYLWNVSPADFGDPKAAARMRLVRAYELIEDAGGPEGRKAVLANIDDRDELARAFEAAQKAGSSRAVKQALFIDGAMNTKFIGWWVDSVEKAARTGAAPELRKAEEALWSGLAGFSSAY